MSIGSTPPTANDFFERARARSKRVKIGRGVGVPGEGANRRNGSRQRNTVLSTFVAFALRTKRTTR
jgi:hypothetical protein